MKSVLLTSADKLKGVHGSNRTLIGSSGYDWEGSDAFADPMIPLDIEFGAGHLNAGRAVELFAAGEVSPGTIGKSGWDYGVSGGVGDQFEYTMSEAMDPGDYLSVTLVWDRLVTQVNPDDSVYHYGDPFANPQLSNLNLYVYAANGIDLIASSTALDSSVEHIFVKNAGGGAVKIVVTHANSSGSASSDDPSALFDVQQPFALSWWAIQPESPVFVPGDFNGDNRVDGGDLDLLTGNWNATVPPAPSGWTGFAPTAPRVDNDELDALLGNWGYGTSTAVPEPGTSVLALIFAISASAWRSARD